MIHRSTDASRQADIRAKPEFQVNQLKGPERMIFRKGDDSNDKT